MVNSVSRMATIFIFPGESFTRFILKHFVNRLFIVEAFSPIRYPKKYVSKYGQLLEHSPYCERDMREPVFTSAKDETGDFLVRIKKQGMLYGIHYAHHPFDVVGWDGCCYPYIFSIHNFEPITGRIHQPPPVHLTFEGNNFVVCSFVPRLFDYHPLVHSGSL